MEDISNYANNELLKTALNNIYSKNNFDDKLLKTEKILDIMYNYTNVFRLKKWFIEIIIKLIIKIFKESLSIGLKIKLPTFGIFFLEESQNDRIIKFIPHKEFLNINNIYNMRIFEINDLKNKSSFININVYKSIYNYPYCKKSDQIPKIKKVNINLKEKILSNNELISIKDNTLSLMALADLIKKKLSFINFDKSYIPKIINQFLMIVKEAFILGITIELENFGTFHPAIRTNKTKDNKKNDCIFYKNGTVYKKIIHGWKAVIFNPSESLILLVNYAYRYKYIPI